MILIFTDLHAFMPNEKEKAKDVLKEGFSAVFLLGDIRDIGVEFIRERYEGPIYFVYGNHDEYGDYSYISGLTNIHGKKVEVEGRSFIGIEGCARYKISGVAHTQEEIISLVETLPSCDVLLSHEGPVVPWSTKVSHFGYQGINDYLKDRKTKMCIHGHKHINKMYECEGVPCVALYKCATVDFEKKRIERIF